jgi:hypothetical protein
LGAHYAFIAEKTAEKKQVHILIGEAYSLLASQVNSLHELIL